MAKVRIVYRDDDSVAVIHPAPNSKREDETEAEWLERVFSKAMHGDLEGCDYNDVDISEIPAIRKYREAWEKKPGGGIQLNAAKKAEIDARVDYEPGVIPLKEVSEDPPEPPVGEAALYLKMVNGKRTVCLRSNNQGGLPDIVEVVRED